jgi:hypothetical protein
MPATFVSRPTLLLELITAAWGGVVTWSFWKYGRLS